MARVCNAILIFVVCGRGVICIGVVLIMSHKWPANCIWTAKCSQGSLEAEWA